MWRRTTTALAVLLISAAVTSAQFYLPGVAPANYADGEHIEVKVVKLDSVKTQLPYDYYSLDFCQPTKVTAASENLGEILSGDEIKNSAYAVQVGYDEHCSVLCMKQYTNEELRQFAERIEDEYRVNWLLDNIPAATKYFTRALTDPAADANKDAAQPDVTDNTYVEHYEKGFALGFVGSKEIEGSTIGASYLNNHLRLIIKYNDEPETTIGTAAADSETPATKRIVGFEVEAHSVAHTFEGTPTFDPATKQFKDVKLTSQCPTLSSPPKPQIVGQPPQPAGAMGGADSSKSNEDTKTTTPIVWTYDVEWDRSNIKWASRWDVYLKMTDSKIHWFSIINSIMIVLFLSGMVAVIMIRILHRDLARYNNEQLTEEEQKEETGWKLIHGDVFRPPPYGQWLAVLVGTGAQVFAMTLITLVFAALGFLSPANRGGLMMALLFLFVFMGTFAGYHSTRIYKMFQLTEWKKNTLVTALAFPGIVFTVFFILNLFVWSQKSSSAVPFGTLVALLVLWLGISVPLVYLGSYVAFKSPTIEHPVKVNNLCRLLPPDANSSWYTSPQLSILLGGILPFAAVFIEIFFIMSSVWLNQFYYVFGFLFIVFIILIITCAEITIVLCYFQLCNEDYHWWWRAFLTPGSSALYLFLYSILYFFTKLQIVKSVSAMLFFGYMLLVCLAFFVLTGTIGYFACFYFVTKIYASLKID